MEMKTKEIIGKKKPIPGCRVSAPIPVYRPSVTWEGCSTNNLHVSMPDKDRL